MIVSWVQEGAIKMKEISYEAARCRPDSFNNLTRCLFSRYKGWSLLDSIIGTLVVDEFITGTDRNWPYKMIGHCLTDSNCRTSNSQVSTKGLSGTICYRSVRQTASFTIIDESRVLIIRCGFYVEFGCSYEHRKLGWINFFFFFYSA